MYRYCLFVLILLLISCSKSEEVKYFPILESGIYFSELTQGDKSTGYLFLIVEKSNYLLKVFNSSHQEIISKRTTRSDKTNKSLLKFTGGGSELSLSAGLNLNGQLEQDSQLSTFRLARLESQQVENLESVDKLEDSELKEVIALAANYNNLKNSEKESQAASSESASGMAGQVPEDLQAAIRDLQQDIFSLQVKLEKKNENNNHDLANVNRQLIQAESKLLLEQLNYDDSQLEAEKSNLISEISALSDDIYILKHQLGR